MTGKIFRVVLPLSVLEIGRLHEDARSVLSSALAVGARVFDADHHRVRDLALSRRPAIVTDVADDHGAVADPQLGSMALPDLHSLREPERAAKPIDRLPNVRVNEDRDDRGLRDRAVGFQAISLACRPA
jgi:hypothetical protein